MTTLHAQLVLSEEAREIIRHLQPGQHLNVTLEAAPHESGEQHGQQPPHAAAHEQEKEAHLNRPTSFSHYNRPEHQG